MTIILAGGLLLGCGQAGAQSNAVTVAADSGGVEVVSLDDVLQQTIDPDVLRLMQQLQGQDAEKLFTELQQAMSGTNLHQLAELRQTAKELIPVLQKYDATAAYGDWLQTRLEDMEAAAEWERSITVARGKSGGVAVSPETSLRLEREVWSRRLRRQAWPVAAHQYVPEFKRIFVDEGVPPQLVWLAEVESSFKAGAKSPAGAAGMFQLMPETARVEKLSLWPRDERLQPDKSARAAARYLRSLYLHYGNWRLALAAYNAGSGRVDQLLKKKNTFDGIARRLPMETQLYVPKVEAVVREREGKDLGALKLIAEARRRGEGK